MKITKNILDPFIKLWQKANGEKRKVTSKFFEAFFGAQQKVCMNFVQKCFVKWLFCHSREKAVLRVKKLHVNC
jgi:hypothetical protein